MTGCSTQGQRREGVRDLHIRDVSGYLEGVARQREREQISKVGGTDVETKETIFEENLGLTLDGYVYHPNFAEFTLGGAFGLLQEEFDQTRDGVQRSSSEDGSIDEFDLSATFLKKKPYPGTVYARRHRAIEPRPFQPSLENITTSMGLRWQYVDEKMPTNIEFDRTTTEFNALGSDEQQGRQQSTTFRFDTAYNFSPYHTLGLRYSRQAVEQEPFGFNYDSDDISLSHRLAFGGLHQHQLDSELSALDQRGTFEIERRRWRERLRLQHLDNLRSWYEFEALDRTQGSLSGSRPIEERSVFLSGSLEHQLYESLTSQATVFGQRQEFGSGVEVDREGGSAGADYRKKNSWGVLRANYRFGLQTQDRRGGQQRVEVFDVPHVFRDPEPLVLEGGNISTTSIVITDEDAKTLYQPGRDYRVRVIGNTVEIERIPTGTIAEGQTVLVDYAFDAGGDFTLDSVQHNFGIRQEFDFGLTPYYRFRKQDQTLSPEQSTGFVAEDITAHILGTEYRRGPWNLSAEYEDRESNIAPYEAIRLNGGYTHHFDFGATANLAARWSDIQFGAPQDRGLRFLTLEGRYRHPVTARLNVEGAVLYRRLQDTLSGDDEGIDFDFSLEYIVRQTTMRLTYEFGQFEDDFTDNQHSALFVQVRRRF